MDTDARREKLMLSQKLMLSLKPMPMPTMDMVVMDADMEVTVAVMEDMVDTDKDVNVEVVMKVDIHNIVQGHRAGSWAKWTILVFRRGLAQCQCRSGEQNQAHHH